MNATQKSGAQAEIKTLLEELTSTGRQELDASKLRNLKTVCKQSDDNISLVHDHVMCRLAEKHSEIRYSALQICDELFCRSHYFRELLLLDMKRFFEMTIETNAKMPLPPPQKTAKEMCSLALKIIAKWYAKYGKEYKKLALGYDYLKKCKRVDFSGMTIAEKRERDRKEKLATSRREQIEKEMGELVPEITSSLVQANACFELLIPHPDNFFVENVEDGSSRPHVKEETATDGLRSHGIADSKFQLEVQIDGLPKIIKTNDNAAVVDNLEELKHVMCKKYLPEVKKWLTVLGTVENVNCLMKQAIDLKRDIEAVVTKCATTVVQNSDSDESTDDSDFEEVPMAKNFEKVETHKPCSTITSLTETCTRNHSDWRLGGDVDDPTTFSYMMKQWELNKEEPQPGPSKVPDTRKDDLLSRAPKLPFDIDLYNWEEKREHSETIDIGERNGLHRFWLPSVSSNDTMPNPEPSNNVRMIEFSGKFEPVTKSCRAPLPSGKLCPRHDRFKCPLHGPIIPRDHTGKPVRPEDIAQLAEEEKKKAEDWQDPQLLAEIKAATGVDLTIHKGRKKRKKPENGLTDLKKHSNTVRRRLTKKLTNKSSVKKINSALNTLQHRRIRDKFGDQWNYVHETS